MQYIQDRERIVKRVLKGKGSLGNDTPISSAHGKDFCSELPQRLTIRTRPSFTSRNRVSAPRNFSWHRLPVVSRMSA